MESILQQDYPDLSLLIWDDGSTDGTLDAAKRYAEQDNRIQ
ncbi:MAG TPA: glycosyltransferase [Clostridiales bacterium]|nr:glycosyltransferase [Clostridiales bacterium]